MEVVAKNKISGRTAQAIVAAVTKSGQCVLFRKDGRTINAGSLLGILSLVILPGDTITITTENNDSILEELKTIL